MPFDAMNIRKIYIFIFCIPVFSKKEEEKSTPIINMWIRFDFDVSGIAVIMLGGNESFFLKKYYHDVYILSSCCKRLF